MQILEFILGLFGRKKKPVPPINVGVSGAGPVVAVMNESTVVSDTEAQRVMQALQVQTSRDFAPLWGQTASLVFIPKGGKPPAGAWWMVLMDSSDVAGALGYHDLTSEGLPLAKVFCKTTIDDGAHWSVCASHELLEMLGDSNIDLAAQVGDSEFWSYENCDATEGDEFGYLINNILVSDFVTKEWWNPNALPGTQFDFCGHLKSPLEILPGGYISSWTPGNGWGMVMAQKPSTKTLISSRGHVGSRRERRRTPKSQWVKSSV